MPEDGERFNNDDDDDALTSSFVSVSSPLLQDCCSSALVPPLPPRSSSSLVVVAVETKAHFAIILFKHSVTVSPPAGSPISIVSLTSKCKNKCGSGGS